MTLIILSCVVLVLAIIVGVFFWQDIAAEQKNDQLINTPSGTEVKKNSNTLQDTREGEKQITWRRGSGQGEFWIINPTSGVELYAVIFYPEDIKTEESVDLLVLVPGGNNDSSSFIKKAESIAAFTDKGLAILAFDPDGRGNSLGEEDQNGYVQQDGLVAIIDFAINGLPDVKVGKLGVASTSFGLSMASGTLARYPELPVSFLIDWEGPIDRNDFAGCDSDRTGHLKGRIDCDNEVYFAEREGINFVPQLKIPYLRMQSEKDHAQPDILSAVRIVNAAVQSGVPWVRLNEFSVNEIYSEIEPPRMYPDALDKQLMSEISGFAKELFAL